MKIRTREDFFDSLDRESSWRKQELTNLSFFLKGERSGYQDLSVRSSVALCYAHWEGFVKNSSENYLIYLSSKKLKGKEASASLQRTFLLSKIGTYGEIRKIESLNEFMNYCEKEMPNSTLQWDHRKIISTKSNLFFEVFEDILVKLDLDKNRYEMKAHKIDALVGLRNSIAHGERPTISQEDAIDYVRIIRELIDTYKTDLINLVAEEKYKWPSPCESN